MKTKPNGLSNLVLTAAAAVAMLMSTATASAANKPCSKGKGGISHCQGALFICNDGSASQSKKICSASDAPPKSPKKAKP